jgi:hypothetical protein
MTPEATQLRDALESAKWFRNSGTLAGKSDENTLYLSSWPDAFAACRAESWEQICRVTANLLFEHVAKKNPEEAKEWQEAVAEMFQYTADLLPRKAVEIIQTETPSPVFVSSLAWTVQHALLEAEFLGTAQPLWYGSLADWIVKGYFPCGWSGVWPKGGRLIVM